MDYEKKYKEALERAKQCLIYPDMPGFMRVDVIFPELKESKEERIRKMLYGWVCTKSKSFFDSGYTKEDVLTWLEKQKGRTAEIEKAYKNADEVQYSRGYEDGVKSVRWTEEDENRMNDALRILSFSVNFNFSAKEEVSKWLYELKNRLTN